MRKLIVILLSIFAFNLQAQEFEVGLKAGASLFHGDAIENVFDFSEISYGAGLFARYHFDHNFAFKASLNYQNATGDDANNSTSLKNRGLSHNSNLIDFTITAEWNFLGVDIYTAESRIKSRFTPYALLGVGGVFYDATVLAESDSPGLDPLDAVAKNPNFSMVVPMGLGVRYSMDRLVIGLEGTLNAGLNDYLDGISRSGDHDDNDWYTFVGVTVAYRIGAQPKARSMDEEPEEILEEGDIIIEEEY